MIVPLQCVSCNAPLAIADADWVACPFCGTKNTIPEKHREALRLSRDLDETTRNAIKELARLNAVRISRVLFIGAAVTPFVLLAVGVAFILVLAVFQSQDKPSVPLMLGFGVLLPLIPAQAFAANIGMRNVLVSSIAKVGAAFSARPPVVSGAPPNCRQCGAPLTVQPDDLVVRCVYCTAESIVEFDSIVEQDFEARIGFARSSLAEAMAAFAKHTKLVRVETHGRTYVIAGLLIFPMIWSLTQSFQTNYWSMLIAFDIWVLAICIFWNVREAFLPPVTIEELYSLLPGTGSPLVDADQNEAPLKSVAGTRGWYEHSSDKRNFVIPLFVALMFLTIQWLVLNARLSGN